MMTNLYFNSSRNIKFINIKILLLTIILEYSKLEKNALFISSILLHLCNVTKKLTGNIYIHVL